MKFIKCINIFCVSSRANSCLSCLQDHIFLKRLDRLLIWYSLAQENRNMSLATECRMGYSTFVWREMRHPIVLYNFHSDHQTKRRNEIERNINNLNETIAGYRFGWAQHLLRINDTCIHKLVHEYSPGAKRNGDRPRKRWKDQRH